MQKKPYLLILILVVSMTPFSCLQDVRRNEITIFAAASLAEVMEKAALLFETETGCHVNLNLASSGMLARQIIAGATADIYVSASESWMEEVLSSTTLQKDHIKEFCQNSLVIITGNNPGIRLTSLENLPEYIEEGITIGDPEHVPAGMYARESLQNFGIWDDLKNSLIRALDVRAALSYVEKGEVSLGIVYKSDVSISDKVRVVFEIPANSHGRITYQAAFLSSENDAKKFYKFLDDPKIHNILRQSGFVTP